MSPPTVSDLDIEGLLESMVCEKPPKASAELTHEDIFDALDSWLGARHVYREFKVRPISLGRICTLFESGCALVEERGTHTDSAIENALRKVGAL
jgi:hypothetical protein